MTELTSVDVEEFTNGRLLAASENVQKMLEAALVVSRRRTGWHVSPVLTETVFLDGPGSKIFWVPTKRIVDIESIIEDGRTLNINTVKWSTDPNRNPALRKAGNAYWTSEYGGIEMRWSHGYTEAEAADWRRAILGMVDQMSLVPVKASTGVSEAGLRSKQVDDVVYRWDSYIAMAEEVIFSAENTMAAYTLPSMEFI